MEYPREALGVGPAESVAVDLSAGEVQQAVVVEC